MINMTMKTVKLAKILTSFAFVAILAVAVPTQAEAFTLFGIRFFEKPTPTPTIAPTIAPTIVATPTVSASPVVGAGGNLPSTGPETGIAAILVLISGAFIARKYWQVPHKIK